MSDPTLEVTQESRPAPKKKFRLNFKKFFLGLLALIALAGLGAYGGYRSAVGERVAAQSARESKLVTEQYALALMDISSGQYGIARQRLEYIIQTSPDFPEAAQKLAEVMVLSQIPTATPPPTVTPTPDMSSVVENFQKAQQFIAAMDWPHAIESLDNLRRKDASFHTAEVDGMYYFALRNYGYDLITKQGNLEGGIYQLTLAERFGPLDNMSNGLRDSARLYLLGASFWDLDWKNAIFYFSQLYTAWPNMWDGTMTASERYRVASIRYGDELLAQEQWCAAYEQYKNAEMIAPLDAASAKSSYQAMMQCNPPLLIPTEIPPTP